MNKEDFDITQKWNEEGFVKFGRIKFHSIVEISHNVTGTHWIELSEEAWKLAHAERRARCKRIMAKRPIDKTREK